MEFKQFSIESLIQDDYFIRWVKNPDTEDGSVWINWASLSVENELVITEARSVVLQLSEDNDAPFEEELGELWNRINFTNAVSSAKHKRTNLLLSSFWCSKPGTAAAAIFLAFCIGGLLLLKSGRNELYADYGNSKRVVLPDSSVVILNGNSTIRYSRSWKDEEREVWLEGEAFFSVSHKPDARKFIVHTSDLDVQVTGTKFNVNTYHERTRVVLNSGKVKLHMNNTTMEMDPGDLVIFSAETKKIEKKVVNTTKYISWVNRKFVFEDTRLSEIAVLLEDNYGYKITFSDSDVSRLTFTGVFDSANTDVLFKVIERSFGLTITKDGKHILIKR